MSWRSNRLFPLIGVALIASIGLSILAIVEKSRPARVAALPPLEGEKAISYLKEEGVYSSLEEALKSVSYRIESDGGSCRASNPAQGYRAVFKSGETVLTPSHASAQPWQLGLEITGFGYGTRTHSVLPGPMITRANRIEIPESIDGADKNAEFSSLRTSGVPVNSTSITEWFVNRPEGLEHGFTLLEAPGMKFDGEMLRLRLNVSGGLKASLGGDRQSITLVDKKGGPLLAYDHLSACDATGRALHALFEIAGNDLAILVDDSRAVYPLTIDPVLTQVRKLTASDGVSPDQFGNTTSISGDIAVVGAPNKASATGAVYIFERNVVGGDQWGEVKKLTASDGQGNDAFGRSVSISGDTIVVGAPQHAVGANGFQGSAYIFVRNKGGANNWGEVKILTASDGASGDSFGNSVAISGDRVIVGARSDDIAIGSAYIFERNKEGVDNWGEVKKVVDPNGTDSDFFGTAVSISNDTAIVGSPESDSLKGSAFVFERNLGGADNWGLVKKLSASDGANNRQLGLSVSIDGDVAIAGLPNHDTARGAVYIFTRNAGGADQWGEIKILTASDAAVGDQFGITLSLNGDSIVVGAPNNNLQTGAGYLFTRNRGGADNWGEAQKLTASDGVSHDEFGRSVAVCGDTVFIGADRDENSQGSVYTFTDQNKLWSQLRKPVASDGATDDNFGRSVSVSGSLSVVGASSDDSLRGSAYIFERNKDGGDNWGQIRKLTASDGVASDLFGNSVSISGDTIVVGALNSATGRGASYIFGRNRGGPDNWGEVKKLTASDGVSPDQFGSSAAISGDTVVVGASGDDASLGSAYVFERNRGGADNWGEVKKLINVGGAANSFFGTSVSISNDTAVVGSPLSNSSKGSALVFERNAGGADNWGNVTKLTGSDSAAFDRFGTSVSISGDTATVGSSNNSSGAGAAYIFARNHGGADNWGEVNKLTALGAAANDAFGVAVAISNDTVIIGALDDTVGTNVNQGSAYIFERNQGGADNWGQVQKLTASDGIAGDLFGVAVGIGDRVAMIGAGGDDSFKGGSYIFIRTTDTVPPAITCPAGVIAIPAPGAASVVVTFPAPVATDNVEVASVICSPASGSTFPLGTTTVTCTAADSTGNTAQCSFTVTTFDFCLQDDSTPAGVLSFNSLTGDYRFCCGGTSFTGKGTVLKQGLTVTLTHNASDRRLQARVDGAANRATASLQSPPGTIKCTITDRNIKNNTCACQ